MDLGFRGKTAIVTGGASGIGLETARLFAREGARIAIADLDPARIRAAQTELEKLGEKRMAAYSATKGAVIAFTKAFAAELGRVNVRVNAVCPGVTRTPMTAGMSDEIRARAARVYPLGRLGEPADIASMIAFLASPQTSWVTGQAISVSGGFGRA